MRALICLTVLILLLSACSSNLVNNEEVPTFDDESTATAQGTANTSEDYTTPEPSASGDTSQVIYSLTEIIPYLDDATNISVKTVPLLSIVFNAFAPADKVQSREIVDFLMLLETTKFIEEAYQGDELLFNSPSVIVENPFGSCWFAISGDVDDNSIFYIILYPDQTREDILAGEEQLPFRFFKGQSGEFPIRDFGNALNDVLLDTNDLQNVAVVQELDDDAPEYTLNKGFTANLRYALEDAIELYSTVESSEEQSFDIKIVIGDTTYLLNSTSGIFNKEKDGVIVFSKFEEDKLLRLLEFLNRTSNSII